MRERRRRVALRRLATALKSIGGGLGACIGRLGALRSARFQPLRGGGKQDGSSYGVFGQRFDSGGARAGTEFQVNTYTTGDQGSYPQAVAVSPNNFVIVWHDRNGEDGSGRGVFAQRFSPLVPPLPAAEHVAPALSSAALILLALGLVSLGSAVVVRKRR